MLIPDSFLFFSHIYIAYTTFSQSDKSTTRLVDTSFNKTLKDESLRDKLKRHLESEFSAENLEFWVRVEKFKSLPPSKLKGDALQIYSSFIKENSLYQV